jgi:AcrR family transcriptional regulator
MTSEEAQRGYHHGNLRTALIAAGVELARTGGPSAVLLRAASREAGVSHNAAYRHFANQEDLVAAVAERCMEHLGRLMVARMDEVTERGPVPRALARLAAIGRAYIDFARTEPGWFRTAFSSARPHDDAGPPLSEMDESLSPYALLTARLDEVADVGAIAADRRPGAEYVAWSAVHGISSLLLDGPLRALPGAEVEQVIETVLAGVTRSLGA